jgi:hypothetical protein
MELKTTKCVRHYSNFMKTIINKQQTFSISEKITWLGRADGLMPLSREGWRESLHHTAVLHALKGMSSPPERVQHAKLSQALRLWNNDSDPSVDEDHLWTEEIFYLYLFSQWNSETARIVMLCFCYWFWGACIFLKERN